MKRYTSKPVFSAEDSKKAWLIVAVGVAGASLNKQPSVKADELWFSDTTLMKNRIVHVFPASIAKSLQRRAKNDQIDLEGMYREIKRNLVQKTIQKMMTGRGER